MLRLYRLVAEKPEALKKLKFDLKKALPMLRKMLKTEVKVAYFSAATEYTFRAHCRAQKLIQVAHIVAHHHISGSSMANHPQISQVASIAAHQHMEMTSVTRASIST